MRHLSGNFRNKNFIAAIIFFFAMPACADGLSIHIESGPEILLQVEMADTPELREKGLMGRTHLDKDAGMLFVFDKPATPQFWMKDTPLPLDMIFIGVDGRVVGVYPGAKPYDLTPIPAPEPVLAVLEINGGRSKTLGISTGAQVIHRIFENHLK